MALTHYHYNKHKTCNKNKAAQSKISGFLKWTRNSDFAKVNLSVSLSKEMLKNLTLKQHHHFPALIIQKLLTCAEAEAWDQTLNWSLCTPFASDVEKKELIKAQMPKRQDMKHSKSLFMKQLQLAEVCINSFSSFSVGWRGFRRDDSIHSSDKDCRWASNGAWLLILQNNQSISAIMGKVTQHGNNTEFLVFWSFKTALCNYFPQSTYRWCTWYTSSILLAGRKMSRLWSYLA